MQKIIEVKDLGFGYGKKPIFMKIDLTVKAGDFVAIIGSNGTGKSSLLKVLLKELTPRQGRIALLSEDINQFKAWHKIGYVPQSSVLKEGAFPATALEVVVANLFWEIGLLRFPKKRHMDKAKKALALVGMEDQAKALIGQLSGGQQQRVMIARALVSEPMLMFLDEPTTGIDARTTEDLYQLLSKLNKEMGLTIVMVTHDIRRASKYVSRTLCLGEGSLVELDAKQVEEELKHKHTHPVMEMEGVYGNL